MKNKLKTAILLSGISLGVLHVINRCVTAASTVRELLSKHSGHYFPWKFGNVFYTVHGTGKPLLLIHDTTPCSSSYEWEHMIHQLEKHYKVYAIDLLGCGRSEKPNMTYTNFLYVQLISDFISQIIQEKASVAATGISGSYVIMACNNNPDLFENIMLINPESISRLLQAPGKRERARKFLLDLPVIGTAVYLMLNQKENIEYQFTEQYLYNPFHMQKKDLDVFHESAHLGEAGGKYLMSSLKGHYLTVNIVKALSEINNNIMIVSGKQKTNADKVSLEYISINPSIEVEFVQGAKQLPQIETPDELYQLMKLL